MGRTVRDVRRWMMFRDDAFRTRGLACQHTHGRHDLENHGDRADQMRPTKSTVHTLDHTRAAGNARENIQPELRGWDFLTHTFE